MVKALSHRASTAMVTDHNAELASSILILANWTL